MDIKYKIDVLEKLKECGYSSYRLRKEKLIGESYLQQLRAGELVSWEIMSRLCKLLKLSITSRLKKTIPQPRTKDLRELLWYYALERRWRTCQKRQSSIF